MEEKSIKELKLNKSILEMEENSNVTVEIVSGNGDFTIQSSGQGVATANISGNTITINAVSSVSATLTVEDAAEKSVTLEVSVSSTTRYRLS